MNIEGGNMNEVLAKELGLKEFYFLENILFFLQQIQTLLSTIAFF